MKLTCLRLSNFRSFGPDVTTIELNDMTYLLGPNGAGKTATLKALARLFSLDPAQRRIRKADFHVPTDEAAADVPDERALWMEADFTFPELEDDGADANDLFAVPGNFAHMQLVAEDGPARVRFHLEATIDEDGEIEENLTYVTKEDENGNPLEKGRVSKQDRNAVQVHYLPARRDPAEHISYAANALLGRALRSANWSAERETIGDLTESVNTSLARNIAVDGISKALEYCWKNLHKGTYYAKPSVTFAAGEVRDLLRHLSIIFTPGHGESVVDFSRLSDGQKSLLYVSLVLGMYNLGRKVLTGELEGAFNVDKLRPAVFTMLAIEEPENSLSPHYLGRVTKLLTEFSGEESAQAVVATHSPSLLRRVAPESVRYLRLDERRTTIVKEIELPKSGAAYKFVREGVQAFPELYFSRLVVLGEGDSEEIVLPRLLAARGILSDDASLSVVPLGGRHVNHFWRLLHGLGIPHVTLLDLDVARYGGGWGRIHYVAQELLTYVDPSETDLTEEEVNSIPVWNSDEGVIRDDLGWLERLERAGIFFSAPLDLDFMMMLAYPDAYKISDENLEEPDEKTLNAVLGKKHDIVEGQYSKKEQSYFGAYHRRFKLGSKPSQHIRALARMDDDTLLERVPEVLMRMFGRIKNELKQLPE